jgi:hypothetical protein
MLHTVINKYEFFLDEEISLLPYKPIESGLYVRLDLFDKYVWLDKNNNQITIESAINKLNELCVKEYE